MNDGTDAYYYVHDHLYSPVALVDDNGTVVERYEYDAYGRTTIMDASYNSRSDSSYDNPYYFTGRRMDKFDSGNLPIIYYRNRYYDTYTGRFTTHDPLGVTPNPQRPNAFIVTNQYKNGTNFYEYTTSNPVEVTDPYGLWSWPWHWWKKRDKNLNAAYDWWEPVRNGKLYCEKPCRWRNDGDTKRRRYRESGLYSYGGSLPLAPGCGPALAIAGIVFEVINPSVRLGGPLVEDFACVCEILLTRRCKSKCCDCENGVWTKRKKMAKRYVAKGRAWRYYGVLECSCNPQFWRLSPRELREKTNAALDCTKQYCAKEMK